MMKNAGKNWLTIVFIAVIFFGGMATVILGWRPIGETVRSNIQRGTEYEGAGAAAEETIAAFDSAFAENLWGKSYWVEVLGLFNRMAGKSIILDASDRYTVYKMKNGQETWNYSGYDMAGFAKRYRRFAKEMRRRRIPLLYIQAPFKIDKYSNGLPYGMRDETNPLADKLLEGISEYDTLDLREVIHEEKDDYASLFYDTDHHWTPETGLWAAGVITEKLKKDYGLNLDDSKLPPDNYTYTTYPDYMLGSQGKRAGALYSGLDDFVLIEPNYDTDYRVEIPARKLIREGECCETLLFMKYLKREIYNGDPGRVYAGDNYSLMKVTNNSASNSTRLLLVKDSFSKPVIPPLAYTCRELHVLDLRTFDGSVVEYADENDIDMAVVMYNPSVVVNAKFFDFYK